jgi:hypothetical protein
MYDSNYSAASQPITGGLSPYPEDVPATNTALFNAPAVTLAAFFGTPVAGAVLMAVNYRRLGQQGHAALILVLGLLVSTVAVLVAYYMPSAASTPLGIGLLLGTRIMALKLQGGAVAKHVSQGGKLGSKWVAAGVGLGFMVILFLSIFVPVYASTTRTKVMIGKDEVFYSNQATKEDAQKLGDALKAAEYFTGRGTSVFLNKDKDGTTLSLVMQEGVWDRPGMLFSAEEVAREVADSIGGYPVHVRIVDAEEHVKKQGQVGRVAVGKDEIYYFGDAAPAQAEALGKALKSEDYLQDRGVTVMFDEEGGNKSISFVVSDGFWDDPNHMASFETLIRAVAPSVGGLPVTLKLVNVQLEDKKDLEVK